MTSLNGHSPNGPLRVGIGGPVGSGKTALMEQLCKRFRDRFEICAITNDIYTKEDARILTVAGALPEERIMGVETGGCPHTAIREDASINLAAVAEMRRRFPKLDLILIESGGDNLARPSRRNSPDLTLYVIDVAGGEKIPRKGGPGITRSDLLIVNKTDLAPMVGADLGVMEADTRRMRGTRPTCSPPCARDTAPTRSPASSSRPAGWDRFPGAIHPRPHPEAAQRSGVLEGGVQGSPVRLEPFFEAASRYLRMRGLG